MPEDYIRREILDLYVERLNAIDKKIWPSMMLLLPRCVQVLTRWRASLEFL